MVALAIGNRIPSKVIASEIPAAPTTLRSAGGFNPCERNLLAACEWLRWPLFQQRLAGIGGFTYLFVHYFTLNKDISLRQGINTQTNITTLFPLRAPY